MGAQVVCISRTLGALGEEIGNRVAERLGFRYVDEQIIERAARLAQVDPAVVAAVEERQSLLRGLIDKLAAARDAVGPTALAIGLPVPGGRRRARGMPDDLRLLIRAAIRQIASDGCAVIVAHAASMTLAERTDIVRVLVTASADTRARRLATVQGITPEAAAEAVADSDRSRRDYLRRFHDVARELPTHYDIVVNTDVVTPARAAEIIVAAARSER